MSFEFFSFFVLVFFVNLCYKIKPDLRKVLRCYPDGLAIGEVAKYYALVVKYYDLVGGEEIPVQGLR